MNKINFKGGYADTVYKRPFREINYFLFYNKKKTRHKKNNFMQAAKLYMISISTVI